MSKETVKKIVAIPSEDAEWFDEMYPQYGAWSWFIREALKRFRELRGDDLTDDLIGDAVTGIDMEDFT